MAFIFLLPPASRLPPVKDQENRMTETNYNAAGNVLSVRDPNGVGYDVVYDLLGRMTSFGQEKGMRDEVVRKITGRRRHAKQLE